MWSCAQKKFNTEYKKYLFVGENSMLPGELEGKEVIDSEAQVVGTVAGIEIDVHPRKWKVTHLLVKLSDDAVKTLGYDKPIFGKVVADLPVDVVKIVSDVVTLKKSTKELRLVAERHKNTV